MGGANESAELTQLTKSDVLNKKTNEPSAISEFVRSAVYSGVESPVRALAQLGGKNADEAVQHGFAAVGIEAPQQAVFNTKQWYAQQIGGAVGMTVPFMLLRGGINSVANKAFGTAAIEAGTQSLTQLASREAALSGAAGLAYGALLTPGRESGLDNTSFYGERLKSGLGTMASFAALGFAGTYAGAGLNTAASALERTTFTALPKEAIANALRFPAVAGMIGGIPGGAINAETNALRDGRLLPTAEELKESTVAMMTVGATLGTASWLVDRAQQANVKTREQQAQQELTDEVNKIAPKDSTNSGDRTKVNDRSKTNVVDTDARIELERAIQEVIKRAEQARGTLPPEENSAEAFLNRLAGSTGRGKVQAAVSTREPLEEIAANGKITDQIKGTSNAPGLDIVLGASGIEAPAHAGFLKAIEDANVPVRTITGASGGSLVAALYANKYTATEIRDILLSTEFRNPKLSVLAECMHTMDPWNLWPYSIDFRPWIKDFVQTYNLKPQDNLRIVAADAATKAPFVFEGKNYDLVTALTASTASETGMNMKPVMYNGLKLIDGFYAHPTPVHGTQAPAIVSKIGFVSKPPAEQLSPLDYMMHMRELAYHDEFVRRYPDPQGQIIAETGLPDVATTTFGVSMNTLKKLVQHGYDSTMQRLAEADAQKAIADARKAVEKNVSK